MLVTALFIAAVNNHVACTRQCSTNVFDDDDAVPQPQPLSVSPRKGPTLGGTRMRLEGLRLSSISSVEIAMPNSPPVVCSGLRHIADNLVECRTGAVPAEGEGQILVRVPCPPQKEGKADSSMHDCVLTRLRYDYVALALGELTPDGGPPAGGTLITVRGANFDLNQLSFSVSIGGTPCTGVKVERQDALTCSTGVLTVPREELLGEPARVDVSVRTGDQLDDIHNVTALTNDGRQGHPAFVYYAPPRVTQVWPNVGPVEGGTSLTIRGRGLADTVAVNVRGAACAYVKPNEGAWAGALEPLKLLWRLRCRVALLVDPFSTPDQCGSSHASVNSHCEQRRPTQSCRASLRARRLAWVRWR
jgi:hypothetical protein